MRRLVGERAIAAAASASQAIRVMKLRKMIDPTPANPTEEAS